jgi:hypothetical protein
VARKQGDRARLRRKLSEPPCESRLPELAVQRQAVAGLELERRRPDVEHLPHESLAEVENLLVARIRKQAGAPWDASVCMQLSIAPPREARLELVGSPTEERKVCVRIDEARDHRHVFGKPHRSRSP